MEFKLTLDSKVREWLTREYASEQTILEYGTGGSTLLGLTSNEMNNVIAADTDRVWLENLSREVSHRGLMDRFFPVYQDIGPTQEWGYPDFAAQPYTSRRGAGFVACAVKPWQTARQLSLEPDFVLIDGRFREASFLVSAAFTQKPIKVLFDDYAARPYYGLIESISKPIEILDKAALFHIEPGLVSVRCFLDRFVQLLVDER